MIEEWTPTTEQVRDGYAIDPEAEHHDPIGYPQWERYVRRAFDRWLAEHVASEVERLADEIGAFAGTVLNASGAAQIARARAAEIREGKTNGTPTL